MKWFRSVVLFGLLLVTVDGFSRFAAAEERGTLPSSNVPGAMWEYVSRPEPEFAWQLEDEKSSAGTKIYRLKLVSQKWHDIVWQHQLTVFEPAKLDHPKQMLLFISGGSNSSGPREREYPIGQALAEMTGARVAMLNQVPNQPLLENRKEDELISETWLRYLQTGDTSWPLLFPMVKSAVKAMDALQAFSQEKFDEKVESFVITGASKRGWTSWLAPAVDQRIIASAPMVIDTLNFPEQMKHQKETWGFYSEQIGAYTSKGLIKEANDPQSDREKLLMKMMDPYTYRDQVTVPKLLIVGANDRYWSLDAMNLYWNDLAGPKYAYRLPNAGHNLNDGRLGQGYVMQTVAAFFRHVVTGRELPQISWKTTTGDTELELVMTSDTKPQAVRLWSAVSATTDFRDAKWEFQTLTATDGTYQGKKPKTSGEHIAVYGELQFLDERFPYSFCTLVYCE